MHAPPETAPSTVRADEPTVFRLVAVFGGLLPLVLGTVTLVAGQYREAWLPTGLAYAFVGMGITSLLVHSLRDPDVEFRRAYGTFAAALLVVGLALFALPGKPADSAGESRLGYYFLPWGAAALLAALLFFVPFVRHETDEKLRNRGLAVLAVVGLVLSGGAVVAAVGSPNTFVSPGAVIAVLGTAFVATYLMQAGDDSPTARIVATAFGTLGAAAVVYALGRSIWPVVLFDGPAALKDPFQSLDRWKLAARVASVLASLGVVLVGVRAKSMPGWVRGGMALVGAAFAGVFVYGSFAAPVVQAWPAYVVPHGLLLGLAGVVFLGVAVGAASDAPLVVMTKRELASFFTSPIAYFVLFGMGVLQWVGYAFYVKFILDTGRGGEPVQEPILQNYVNGTIIGPLVVVLFIPVLTMRLFAEEKRSGSLEVLLTAPVSDAAIVLSKFLSAWFFYLLAWVPMGLFLVALRLENPQPFDYRPLVGLYVAVAVSGLAFVGMGLFFSSLTKNQIVAAVMTGAGMLLLFFLNWARGIQVESEFQRAILTGLGRLSYWRLWQDSLGGQLLVRNLMLQGSLAVFWLFLTVKSLESRKWS